MEKLFLASLFDRAHAELEGERFIKGIQDIGHAGNA